MPYRRVAIAAAKKYGPAVAAWAAKKAVSAAKNWYNRRSRTTGRAKSRRGRRRSRGYRKFLRNMGMSRNRVCTMVYRGSHLRGGPTNANLMDFVYFAMNNPRAPGVDNGNISALWNKCATGFDHMTTLYGRFRVISSVAYISIRPSHVFNAGVSSSGTSTYSTVPCVPVKVGAVLSESVTASSEVDAWDDAVMRDDPMKTLAYTLQDPLRGVRFKVRYNARRWKGVKSDEPEYFWGNRTTNPSQLVYAAVWMQSADKVTTPTQYMWLLSWTIKYRVALSDFQGPEDDMKQTTIPT